MPNEGIPYYYSVAKKQLRWYYEIQQKNQKNHFISYHYYRRFGDGHSDAGVCALFILAQQARFVNGTGLTGEKWRASNRYEKIICDGPGGFYGVCIRHYAGAGKGRDN